MSGLGRNPADAIDPMDIASDMLRAAVLDIAERIDADRFTTPEFIEVMQLDDAARTAYEEAIRIWPESDPEMAKLVLHGQTIPNLLRESTIVAWAGYAHDAADPYGVPAWWERVERSLA